MGVLLRPNSKLSTTLSQAVNDTTSTTFNLNAVPTNSPCILLIDPGTSTQEKVKVTSIGVSSVTVIRNFDGAGAYTHNLGATVVDYDSPQYIADKADSLEQLGTVLQGFVVSGLTAPTSGSLSTTIASGYIWLKGGYISVSSDNGHTYTTSQDTYVDVDTSGTLHYQGVSNGATAPSLTANSIRIAKVVTNGSAVTSVTQSGFDGNNVPIYPTIAALTPAGTQTVINKSMDGGQNTFTNIPASALATSAITLGYAQITTNFTTTGGTSAVQVTGLTVPVTIPSGGRKVKITAFTGHLNNNGAGGAGVSTLITIWDGTVGSGTQLASCQYEVSTGGDGVPAIAMAVVTPAAGSKTYNVGLHSTNAGATSTFSASATSPGFILVEII